MGDVNVRGLVGGGEEKGIIWTIFIFCKEIVPGGIEIVGVEYFKILTFPISPSLLSFRHYVQRMFLWTKFNPTIKGYQVQSWSRLSSICIPSSSPSGRTTITPFSPPTLFIQLIFFCRCNNIGERCGRGWFDMFLKTFPGRHNFVPCPPLASPCCVVLCFECSARCSPTFEKQ